MQKKVSKKIKKIVVGFCASALIVFLILVFASVQEPVFLNFKNSAESVENLFYDNFFKIKTGKTNNIDNDNSVAAYKNYDPNILIIDIDEPSLSKLGYYYTWGRDMHAKVVEELEKGGASAIVFDILFKSADFGMVNAQKSINMIGKLQRNRQLTSSFNVIDSSKQSKILDSLAKFSKTIINSTLDSLRGKQLEAVMSNYNVDDSTYNVLKRAKLDSIAESNREYTNSLRKQIYKQDSLKLDTMLMADTLFSAIKSYYNYDSVLVNSLVHSENTIMCLNMSDNNDYQHDTQRNLLNSKERAEAIGFSSTIEQSQIDHPEQIESKDLLDNIFPELAQAATFTGSVNAYPDDDGVQRRAAMLYLFPNIHNHPEMDSKDIKAYSTVSLMTMLHLYHKKPEDITVKMGQYIDMGKTFGIYKDSSGSLHTTYPHFTYPMFESLRDTLKAMGRQQKRKFTKDKQRSDFITLSSKMTAYKDNDELSMDIFNGQSINEKVIRKIAELDTSILSNLSNEEEEQQIDDVFSIKISEEDSTNYMLIDNEDEEEIELSDFVISTIKYYANTLENLKNGETMHLSMDMDLRFDEDSHELVSNIAILSPDVIRDIMRMPKGVAEKLKPGEEFRFGDVKRVPIDKYGNYLINYQSLFNTDDQNKAFQHISYYDVLKRRVDNSFYQGKTFILGSAAPALFDFISGPHEEHYPGVLVHATIIHNILYNKFLLILNENYQRLISILLAILCTSIGLHFKSYKAISMTVLLMVIYAIVAYYLFETGLYLGFSKQWFTMLLTTISALVVQFYYESKEKNFLNNAFKQYISPELIDEMVNNEVMPTLGGSKSNITAYFTDIASFSTFSEKIGDPSKLVDLLNEYLTAMTDTLLGNKGTLDKYEGDAIIAFFGAPMPLENHAQSACDSAIDMQNKLLALRKKWSAEGNKWPKVVHDMHMRIGINSGDIVTGNMGSSMRKNYTMMGDAVNLAARLESAAKQYGAYIQMSEDTQARLVNGSFIYRSLDTIRVVGKSQPVKTFELLERSSCANASTLNTLVYNWEKARDAYLNMEWDKAIDLFYKCLEYEPHLPSRDPGSKTCPSLVYIKRCEDYKKNPPVAEGETWDGVFTATEK